MTDLSGIAGRRARGLTADQKQKISLGRGLVRANVNAILFDEPLTVIDPHMKWVLRSQLKRLHRQSGFTMVYVTHDQTEALTFADKVVVMHNGEIVQIGTPAELFERPKHTFVGYFIGSPGMNLMPARIDGRTATVGAQAIPLPGIPQIGPQIGDAKASNWASGRSLSGSVAKACPSASTRLRISGATASCGQASRAETRRRDRRRRRDTRRTARDLRSEGHRHIRGFLARGNGGLTVEKAGTTKPGSWFCPCWC